MLPLKVFNSLPLSERKRIAKVVFGHMSEEFINEMAMPFHHNFDYSGGHWYKLMLDHCTYDKAKGKIKVSIVINCNACKNTNTV